MIQLQLYNKRPTTNMNNAALESRNKYCWGFVSWWSWHCISSPRNVLSLQFVYQLIFSTYSGQIDAKGKLQEPDKATSNHAYKMFQIIITLIVMPRKVSHKEATDGSFYEGSDKYKIAGSLTTLDHLVTWLSSPCVTQRHSWAIQSGAMLSS